MPKINGSTTKSLSFLSERDPTTILLVKDHAPERKELFYVKIKVSTLVNFVVDRLKKKKKKMTMIMMMKKSAV